MLGFLEGESSSSAWRWKVRRMPAARRAEVSRRVTVRERWGALKKEDSGGSSVRARYSDLGFMLAGYLSGGVEDGVDDSGVGTATAEVAVEVAADGIGGRVGVAAEECDGGEDHGWGTEAALEGGVVEEGLLDGVELAGRGESFDGGDGAADLCGGSEAGADGFAIDQNGASAALAFAAAELGTGEFEMVAEGVEEGDLGREVGLAALSIDGEIDAGHTELEYPVCGSAGNLLWILKGLGRRGGWEAVEGW